MEGTSDIERMAPIRLIDRERARERVKERKKESGEVGRRGGGRYVCAMNRWIANVGRDGGRGNSSGRSC